MTSTLTCENIATDPQFHRLSAIADIKIDLRYASPFSPAPAVDTIAAVPEPASWALMIAGFGLVGAAARRRRGLVVAA